MFVKKDLRKIPRILSDALQSPPENSDLNEEAQKASILTELRLSRRAAEFNGSISILCNPNYTSVLRNLVKLSLYDCQISSLDNIGFLAFRNADQKVCPSLQDLNIGRNPLKTLPEDLAFFEESLLNLWCDDCQLTGSIPNSVLRLNKLETLRMSNNQIDQIPDQVDQLKNLKILCLDGNKIEHIPIQLGKMKKLESLLLR